jgi:hypothetical protein
MILIALGTGLLAAGVGCRNCTHGVCDCEGPPPTCLHAGPVDPPPLLKAEPVASQPLHAEPVAPPKVIIDK